MLINFIVIYDIFLEKYSEKIIKINSANLKKIKDKNNNILPLYYHKKMGNNTN